LIGIYSAEEVYSIRKLLSWQPILGGGFRISWNETLDLSPEEAQCLMEDFETARREEVRAIVKLATARG